MSPLKVLLFSVVGFGIPVALGVVLAPIFFGDSAGDADSYFTRNHADENFSEKARLAPKVIQVNRGSSYAAIASAKELDPVPNTEFLVSFFVRFDKLPEPGQRHNIIAKYDGAAAPYPGWAVAVHRRATSLRPEVYWLGAEPPEKETDKKKQKEKLKEEVPQTEDEEEVVPGGWFTFDDLPLHIGQWYAITLIATGAEQLSLYVQPHGVNVSNSDKVTPLSPQSAVKFAGGYSLASVVTPETDARLTVGAPRRGDETFRGEIALVLIGHPHRADHSIDATRSFLDGGSPYIVQELAADDVSLWISQSGADESKHQRSIELAGTASWQSVE